MFPPPTPAELDYARGGVGYNDLGEEQWQEMLHRFGVDRDAGGPGEAEWLTAG